MALDREYFDAIHIDVVKKKYYNANKVEAVFADIRRQAEALNEENAELRRQLSARDGRADLDAAVVSAQSVYRVIVEKANQRAEAILAEAEQQRLAIQAENQRQRDYSVQVVDQCLQRVRDQQQAALNTLTAAWQDFLCGLYPEEQETPEMPLQETEAGNLPPDLSDKVNAIARELFALDE